MKKYYTPVESAEHAREILAELEERSSARTRSNEYPTTLITFRRIRGVGFTNCGLGKRFGDENGLFTADFEVAQECNLTKLTPREFIEAVCELMPKEVPAELPEHMGWYNKDADLMVCNECGHITNVGEDEQHDSKCAYLDSLPHMKEPPAPPAPKHDWKTLHKDKRNTRKDMAIVICQHADTIHSLKEKVHKLEKSRDWHAEQNDSLIKQRDEQADVVHHLRGHAKDLDDTIQQLRRREGDLEKELEGQTHDKQTAEQNYEAKLDECKRMEGTIADREADYGRYRSGSELEREQQAAKIANLEKALEEAKAEQCPHDYGLLKSENENLRKMLEAAQGTVENWHEKAMQDEDARGELAADVNWLRGALKQCRDTNTMLLQHFAKGGE